MDLPEEEEEEDFEMQLKLEQLEEEKKTREKTYTDKDGTVYEWDDDKGAYFPKIDEDFIASYQMNYGAEQQSSQPEIPPPPSTDTNSKEYAEWYYKYYGDSTTAPKTDEVIGDKVEGQPEGEDETKEYTPKEYFDYYAYYYGHEAAVEYLGYDYYKQEGQEEDKQAEKQKGKKRKKPAQEPQKEATWFNIEESRNTNVYVSGLPLDITEEEFKEFMNKCGLIMYDPRTRKPKLKLYLDEQGQPKGDGRCCYIKVESVDLALQILDGYELKGHKVKVERATFSLKGEFDPTRRKKLTNKEKRKFREKQSKLFDWRPDQPIGGSSSRPKNEKTVVLKNMFDTKDFEADPLLINTLRDDVRTEGSSFGEVKNVKIYDNHPDGVMMVYFKDAEAADGCIAAFNHRWYSKRRIIAHVWDGKTKYDIEESEAERDKRLQKWEEFLDSDEKKTDDTKNNVTKESSATDKEVANKGDSEPVTTVESGKSVTKDTTNATSVS